MAINDNINYGLPGRYTKLPNRKKSTKKTIYSRDLLKNVELFNPDPMPYQKELFKPCTVSRLFDIPRRMNEGFMINDDMSCPKQRGIILNKGRYDWSSMKDVLSNQNDRLVAEENFIKNAKYLKRQSEQKLKSTNHNLILEGENLLPLFTSEKKDKHFYAAEEDSFRHPVPTINSNYDDTLENIDLQQPVSMDVHKIKLKNRLYTGENATNTPATFPTSQNNPGPIPINMFLPPDGRDSYDKLPPIGSNKLRDSDQTLPSISDNITNYNDVFRQSERFNRPNVRLNDYVVDGVPVKYNERADIQAELKFLKSVMLPATARDLFIGRGIHLPSTHATKNPRGRYFDDSTNSRSQMESTWKMDTPGGGSLFVGTNTPQNKHFSPENTPILVSHINNSIEEQNQELDVKNEEKNSFEEIFQSLSPDEEGLVDSTTFVEYINSVGTLLDHEKSIFASLFPSAVKITSGQVDILLKTQRILVNSSQSFRDNLNQIDQNKTKPLLSQFMVSLDPSKNPINAETIFELVINALDRSLTIEKCKELFSAFQNQIESDERSNEDEISQSHIILFIVFLCLNT